MPLPWIKVVVDLPQHPKLLELQERLRTRDGLGVIVRLWCWAARYAPDGRIPERSILMAGDEAARGVKHVTLQSQFCEFGADLDGETCMDALVETGWVEHEPPYYVLHDWTEHQGAHVDYAAKNRERQRRFRERHHGNNVTVTVLDKDREEKKIKDPPIAPQGGRNGHAGPSGKRRRRDWSHRPEWEQQGFPSAMAYADSLRLSYAAPSDDGTTLNPEQIEALVREHVPEAFS